MIDPISMKFCTYQDSTAVLVCTEFNCDQTDMRENMRKHILIKFEILSKFD